MIKYATNKWNRTEIKAVTIDRETEASVWINGRRSAKDSEYGKYHDTWDAAHEHLLEKAEVKVRSLRRQLEVANSELGNVKGLKQAQERG